MDATPSGWGKVTVAWGVARAHCVLPKRAEKGKKRRWTMRSTFEGKFERFFERWRGRLLCRYGGEAGYASGVVLRRPTTFSPVLY